MSAALGLTPMDQSPFVASNVENLQDGYPADIGSPMQQDEDSPVFKSSREQQLAAMDAPTPEEVEKAGFAVTDRMTAFNQDNYPENYARCKELYHFGREHITKLLAGIPLSAYEDKELWERKAKEFMLGCEDVHAWLDEQDALDDEDWEDEEEEIEREKAAKEAATKAQSDKDAKDVKVEPSAEAK